MIKKVYMIFSNRGIAATGLLLVLITCAVLSYNDYEAIDKRTEQIKSNYKSTIDLLRDKVEHEIISREEKLTGYLNILRTQVRSSNYLKSWLTTVEKNNSIIKEPFILNQNGGFITPLVSSEWETDKAQLIQVSEIASIDFKKAEAAEFGERNFSEAIKLYSEALNNATTGDSVILISGIARCYLKSKNYKRALKEYDRLMNYKDAGLTIGSIPVEIAALTQIADIYSEIHKNRKRISTLIELYKNLVDNSWNSNEAEYNYYLKSASNEIRNLYLHNFADDSTKKIISSLQKKEERTYNDENYAGIIRSTLLRELKSSASILATRNKELNYFQYAAKGTNSRLGYFIMTDSFLKPKPLIFGFQINSSNIIENLFPEILRGINLGNDTYAGLLAQNDSVLICTGQLSSQKYLIAENLGDKFFPFKVALFDREGKSIDQQVIQQRQQAFLLFGLTLIVLVIGILIIISAAKHEYQVSKLKSDFVSNVSHELKTPLSIIRMFGETLESGIVKEKSKQQEFYGIIKRESERLTDLINNVLDFSKIESGKKEFNFKEIDIIEVVKNVIESYKLQLDGLKFRLEVILPEKRVMAEIDSGAISQALINLLSNAVKYSGDGKYILIETFESGDNVSIAVEDHGIGMDRKEFKNIFDNFYRISNPKTAQIKGTGLGLTIAKYIVEAHKGTISVKSETGRGSRFTISLPRSFHLS